MVLSDVSIKRPVLAIVMSLIIVLLGVVSYQRLTVREYPNIDTPVVSVTTTYPGADAALMETEVTTVLEDGLAGIEGVRSLTSASREGSSQITVEFDLGRDPDFAAAEVRDRVGRARGELPDDVDEPIIAKVQADADPIIYLGFSSDRHSEAQITDFIDRFIQDELQNIPGVAQAQILGQRRYAMRIWLRALALAGHGMTPQDVESALRAQNLEVPAGRVESLQRELAVRAETAMTTPEEFNSLILRNEDGHLIRLSDVGYATLGVEDDRSAVRSNGRPAVGVGLVKQGTANPLEISEALRAEIPRIEGLLPEGMDMVLAYDSSEFIARSIDNVYASLAEAVGLVVLVIFFFLRSVRSTLIPLVTIPVSLIGAFSMMWLFGFSLNTLSLLAFVLAIGLVVDDAIVMLENIFRHVEEGMAPLQAALRGSREIGFAVVAMTLTLAAVYVPVAFMEGRTGRLFTEFALTLAGAVLISGFVALTLSPMMASRLLKHGRPNLVSRQIGNFLSWLDRGYRRLLGRSLRNRLVIVLIALFTLAGSVVVFRGLPSELAPLEDRGAVFAFAIGPEGATVDYVDAYLKQIEQVFSTIPEGTFSFAAAGFPTSTQGIAILVLKDWEDRERSQFEVNAQAGGQMFAVPGVLAFPINLPSLGAGFAAKQLELVIRDSRPYDEMKPTVDAIVGEAFQSGVLIDVEHDLKLNTPQLNISIDRDRMGDLGLDAATIGRTLQTLLGGLDVTRFERDGLQYDVTVQLEEVERTTPEDLNRIFVRAPSGETVPLSSIVTIEETVGPNALNHYDRLRSVTVSANLGPGVTQGDGLARLEEIVRKHIPPTASVSYSGQTREFTESSSSLYVTFVLALGFIFLVLAAQFESFVDPLIILLTVPLTMLGALLALQFTGNTLNVYSQIGLITLVGLITKHGILITEFANQLQEAGQSKIEAVINAASQRLRPILMTTGAMVLGSVPLATATGAGSESRHQIGWTVVGGLTLGTLLTLFVVPTAYSFIARDRRKRPSPRYDEAPTPTQPSGPAHPPVPVPAE